LSIDALRRRVDELDRRLVRLLNERATLALQIAAEKRAAGMPLNSPGREREVLGNVSANNPGPLDPDAICRIFKAIIAECLRLEEVMVCDRGDEAGGHPSPDSRGEREAG